MNAVQDCKAQSLCIAACHYSIGSVYTVKGGSQLNISYISPPTLSMTIKIEAPILLYSLADWIYQVLQVEG